MLVGQIVADKYRITDVIGQGGMGTVVEAVHLGTGGTIALKLIVSGDVRDPEVMGRFQREARAAGTIDSPHIVRVFDTGIDVESGLPFMVMERLRGEDLANLLKRVGPMSPDAALRITAQACVGLAKAHAAHFVHRDIKPANLFLAETDLGEVTIKLLDFGIAKLMYESMHQVEGGLTQTGSMLGSPHYMSPEQAQGLRTVDHRTDVWSLGVVLFKMLTGFTPHQGDALGQIILAICSQPIRPVQEIAPWLHPAVADIVRRATYIDPNRRFQSTREMFDAIAPLIADRRLDRRHLVGLTATQRSFVAPIAAVSAPQLSDTSSGAHSLARGASAVDLHRHSKPPSTALPVVLALVATLGIAVGGVVAVRTIHARKEALARQVATAPSADISLPVLEMRTVPIKLPQASAYAIEVDGASAPPGDDAIEVTGTMGSEHTVKLTRDGKAMLFKVVITESGAFPPELAFGAPSTSASQAASARSAGPAGMGSVKKPPKPAASASGAATPTSNLGAHSFE